MWKIILRFLCGAITIILLGIIAFSLYNKLGNIKPKEFFGYTLFIIVLSAWTIQFLLVVLNKYPGDLVSFLTWLIIFPLTADTSDRFVKSGEHYFHLDIILAYSILFFTLIFIALPQNRSWQRQLLYLFVGALIFTGASQWVDMSRALRRQLAQLDMRIIHIRERLNGSKCYIPLKDTTIEMVNAKIASIDKILHLARTYLPDTAPIDKFKQAMNEQAASLELHLDSFEFTGSRNIVFYAENFFEGEITGDSERYLKFRHIIENMPWLITWDKEKQTPSGYRFSGRLYDYTTEYDLEKYQHPEKLFTAPSPAKMPDQPRCNIETHVSIWWPPYAARLKRKQDTFTEICMKQRPYRNTLDLESELSQKTEEALSRLEIIYQLAKETNNQFIRSYKADIPPPCYKNL